MTRKQRPTINHRKRLSLLLAPLARLAAAVVPAARQKPVSETFTTTDAPFDSA